MTATKPKFHHVTIKTSHLDEMIAWYALVVGAQVQFKDQVAAWMTNDAANHRLDFLAVPGLSDDAEKIQHNDVGSCDQPMAFARSPQPGPQRTARRWQKCRASWHEMQVAIDVSVVSSDIAD